MKPVDMTIFNTGEGDCLRACVASIFEFPIHLMPNFGWIDDSMEFWKQVNFWTETNLGYRLIPIDVFEGHEFLIKDILCIATGKTSRSDESHAVVWKNECLHDPCPSSKGLTKIESYVLLVPIEINLSKVINK